MRVPVLAAFYLYSETTSCHSVRREGVLGETEAWDTEQSAQGRREICRSASEPPAGARRRPGARGGLRSAAGEGGRGRAAAWPSVPWARVGPSHGPSRGPSRGPGEGFHPVVLVLAAASVEPSQTALRTLAPGSEPLGPGSGASPPAGAVRAGAAPPAARGRRAMDRPAPARPAWVGVVASGVVCSRGLRPVTRVPERPEPALPTEDGRRV